jgi:hypothetical protein
MLRVHPVVPLLLLLLANAVFISVASALGREADPGNGGRAARPRRSATRARTVCARSQCSTCCATIRQSLPSTHGRITSPLPADFVEKGLNVAVEHPGQRLPRDRTIRGEASTPKPGFVQA